MVIMCSSCLIKQKMSLPLLPRVQKTHQLNNQGCRCPICQKVNLLQNMSIPDLRYQDRQSELFHAGHKQTYLVAIEQLMSWQRYPRKLRYCLPQICVFAGGMPVHLITKPKQSVPAKLIRSKSKLNVFELQHFFLEGYLLHHPGIANKKREKDQFKERTRQVCVAAARYARNATALFTLEQLSNMFKSKFKYMREGLVYLQTLVGAHHAEEYTLIVDVDRLREERPAFFARARLEASIFVGETKVTDQEYHSQKAEVEYEQELKRENVKLLLTYLSLKVVMIWSKLGAEIMRESVFRWSHVHGVDFLWDLRVKQYGRSSDYWESAVMQALEVKLKKNMSLMELPPEEEEKEVKDNRENREGKQEGGEKEGLSRQARELSAWLERSTEAEWSEMKIIRSRLQKLQSQKKSLLQSQQQSLQGGNRMFRMRNMRRRQSLNQAMGQSMNQSTNPQL